jgi:hypothetical protein
MFGLGMQELLVLAGIFVVFIPIYLIYRFGVVSGKSKGLEKALNQQLKQKSAPEEMGANPHVSQQASSKTGLYQTKNSRQERIRYLMKFRCPEQ